MGVRHHETPVRASASAPEGLMSRTVQIQRGHCAVYHGAAEELCTHEARTNAPMACAWVAGAWQNRSMHALKRRVRPTSSGSHNESQNKQESQFLHSKPGSPEPRARSHRAT